LSPREGTPAASRSGEPTTAQTSPAPRQRFEIAGRGRPHVEEQDLVRTYELGVNAYVVKPVDFQQFSESVRALGFFWAVLNEAPPPTGRGPTP